MFFFFGLTVQAPRIALYCHNTALKWNAVKKIGPQAGKTNLSCPSQLAGAVLLAVDAFLNVGELRERCVIELAYTY